MEEKDQKTLLALAKDHVAAFGEAFVAEEEQAHQDAKEKEALPSVHGDLNRPQTDLTNLLLGQLRTPLDKDTQV